MASSGTGTGSGSRSGTGIGSEAPPPSEAEDAAAAAAATDLVYTDEQLPEIEIRELVSLYLLEHPFSVFTTQEVQAYVARLVGDERRAGLFASIHAELIHGRDAPGAAPHRPHPPQTRFPVLRNPRPDRSDEEPAEYGAADAEANANPSVVQRDAALDALSFPLEINAEALELDADAAARLYRPTALPPHESAVSATIAGFAADETLAHTVRLFPKDARFPLIQTATVFRRAATSAHQHLAERFAAEPLRSTVLPAAPVLAEPATADEALDAALADLPGLAALSENNVDIHTLQSLLDVYGLELDDITADQFSRIVAAVTEFLAAEEAAEAAEAEEPAAAAAAAAPGAGEPSAASERLAAAKPAPVASAPWEAYAAYLQRPATFEDRLGLYEAFLQNPPAMPPISDIPSRLSDLARDIAQNRMSLADVVAFLRILRARRTYDHISKRIKSYGKFAQDEAEIALAVYRIAWARLVAPSTARSQVKFVLSADISHVAEGQNIAGYDGNRPGVGPSDFAVAAPMGHGAPFTDTELAAGTTIGTFDIPAPQDITETGAAAAAGAEETAATDDALWELGATAADIASATPESLGVRDMSPGTHELATWLLPYFQSIQKASGLPLDLSALAELWKARSARLSTAEQWEAIFVSEVRAEPGPSTSAAPPPPPTEPYSGPLPFLDLQAAYDTIAAVIPPSQHALARAKAREIYAECTRSLRTAFLIGIAAWVIQTQRAAVARAFVFDVLSAHPLFVDKWSVYGPPLTPAAGAQREAAGTLQYIAHVAADTPAPPSAATSEALRFADAAELFAAVLPVFRDTFPDESAALAADWASYKSFQDSKAAKAKAAKESLRAALEARHVPRILREYIRTLLYLPGLLASGPAATARGAAISGCCYQRITPDFRADTDWAQKEKNLANLKAVYGRKRLTQADREAIALPRKPAAARRPPPTAPSAAPPTAPPAAPLVVPIAEQATRVTAWLTALRAPEAAPLSYLPHALIGEILRDSRQALGPLIDRAIGAAIRTSGTRYQTFAASLTAIGEVAPLLSLLNRLQTAYRGIVAERYSAEAAPDAVNERAYLAAVQNNLSAFKAAWTDPRSGPGAPLAIYDERDMPLITRLFHYIVSRALCGPAFPESATRPLSVPLPVNATFLREVTGRMLKVASAALAAMDMPTLADQQAFITEEREKQKREILDQYNDLTVEARQLVLQMKKLGMAAETAAAMQAAGVGAAAGGAPPAEADDYREGLDYNYAVGQNADESEYD